MKLNQPGPSRPPWVTLLIYVGISVVLMTAFVREPQSGLLHRVSSGFQGGTDWMARAGGWVFTPIRRVGNRSRDLGATAEDVAKLRQDLGRLQAEKAALETELDRLQELSRITEVFDGVKPPVRRSAPARIIARSRDGWARTVTIDTGSASGVAEGMPVVCAQGVIGHVIVARRNTSLVRLVTDPLNMVAARVLPSRELGIVRGDGGSQLILDKVSSATTLTAGDSVVTSGLGGRYPSGLMLGVVAEIVSLEGEPHKSARLVSSVDFASLETVAVLLELDDSERRGGQ